MGGHDNVKLCLGVRETSEIDSLVKFDPRDLSIIFGIISKFRPYISCRRYPTNENMRLTPQMKMQFREIMEIFKVVLWKI